MKLFRYDSTIQHAIKLSKKEQQSLEKKYGKDANFIQGREAFKTIHKLDDVPKEICVYTTMNRSKDRNFLSFKPDALYARLTPEHDIIYFVEIIGNMKEYNANKKTEYAISDDIFYVLRGGMSMHNLPNYGGGLIPVNKLSIDLIMPLNEEKLTFVEDYRLCVYNRQKLEDCTIEMYHEYVANRYKLLKAFYQDPKIIPDIAYNEYLYKGCSNVEAKYLIDSRSFTLLSSLAFMDWRVDTETREWYLNMEYKLFEHKIKSLFTEDSIVNAFKQSDIFSLPNLSREEFKVADLDSLKESSHAIRKYFANAFPGSTIKYIYSLPVTSLLKLGSAFNWKNFVVISNRCYFSKDTLVLVFIEVFKRMLRKMIVNPKNIKNTLKIKKDRGDQLVDTIKETEHIIADIKDMLDEEKKRHFKKKVGLDNLISIPDIEECYNKNYMPLCRAVHAYKLIESPVHHVGHFPRLELARYLFGIGKSSQAINNFFAKHDPANFMYYKEELDIRTKRMGMNRTKDADYVATHNMRTVFTCETITMAWDERSTEASGCPFVYLRNKPAELEKSIYNATGLVDETAIEKIKKHAAEEAPRIACLVLFEALHGKIEIEVDANPLCRDPAQYTFRCIRKNALKQS